MDSYTWIFCFLMLVLVNFIIYFMKLECDIHHWKNIHGLVTFVGTLLNQEITFPSKINVERRLVFGLWTLCAIVISNGYSGILSSLMTKSVLPPYPTTLKELTQY